jgi:Fe-S-cluster-containing dehydrogenase component
VLATKDEYMDNRFPGYSASHPRHGNEWLKIDRKVRGAAPLVDAAYLVSLCNHCDNTPCMKSAGNAIRKREDGIVLIDPELAKGRKDLVEACPYGHIHWNEAENLPQAWPFDAHLLDAGWKEPRCAQACPTEAIKAFKLSDAEMAYKVETEELEVLQPELGTKPRVYYKNLHRFNRAFVGGSVVTSQAGRDECVEGAKATLSRGSVVVAEANSDQFGDFKLDKLSTDGTQYQLVVEHPSLGRAELDVVVTDSVYLGDIRLPASVAA